MSPMGVVGAWAANGAAWATLAVVRVAPEPAVPDGMEAYEISPGLAGFLVTFALVLACIPLFRSMTGKVRGVQHRAGGADPAGSTDRDDPTEADEQRPPRPRADGQGGPG